jgi:hypothetical protein
VIDLVFSEGCEMSRANRKLSSLRFTLKDSEAWRIESLALYGGYSYRLIAARAFGISIDKVTRTDIGRVGRALYKSKIRVTDWRNGRTTESRRNIRQVLNEPSNKKLKVAS